ncbi:uncharacterized protein LOC125813818 [Solanum verrucosum]|uniref:uncharacterized protein LOC125813818 n=1 Tax=Solanum verrucosum TaxID=315347 RepID=UPI0020D1B006|nr:uncharacterized protein LOC125813818 [Solanum verrucosum]
MAEYKACILGLKMAIDMNVHELLVIGDSDLLIHQVQGKWAVKNPKITPYVKCIQKFCKRFHKIEFRHTPRTQNELADALAAIASMIKRPNTSCIDPLDIEVKEQPVYCSHVEAKPDGLPWYFDIKKYVDASEAAKLLEQIHAGAGYFLMTMKHDCCKFMQKCHKCQVHGDLIRVFPHELNAMSSPWLFVAWGMDVIGPIEFGVPESIITDNGANLNSRLMREICEQFKITHQNSTAYRPQMNGAVEADNKNIKKILRKMIDNRRVYGTEAVIHVEVKIPSLRIIQEAELSDAERKVRVRMFEVGQLVLKRIFPHQDEYKGKFAPNWHGPYMVRKVLFGGALVLSEMDGTEWPKPIKSDAVKRYYV